MKERLKKTAKVLAERDYGKNPKELQFFFKWVSIFFYRTTGRWHSVSWKYHGWKTRLGFYWIIGCYFFDKPELAYLGFAMMLLGIAHKIGK